MNSSVPGYEQWAYDFIWNSPLFEYGHRDKFTYRDYMDEFFLDIAEIEKLAEYHFEPPTAAEFAAFSATWTDEQKKKVLDEFTYKVMNNRQSERCREVLRKLDEEPIQTLQQLDDALYAMVVRPGDEQREGFRAPHFKIMNAERFHREINDLDTNTDSQSIVQINGALLFITDPPEIEFTKLAYVCNKCSGAFVADKPTHSCPECNSENITFLPEDPETEGRNMQEGALQEHVEDLSGSPASVNLKFYGSLINRFTPGDRLSVVGILTTKRVPRKSTFVYWVDVISAETEGDSKVVLTEDDKAAIAAVAAGPDPLGTLADMFVPEIIGYPEVKKALILQAASGVELEHGAMKVRGRIHVLLAGDPGKAKSQFLMANRRIEEKSMYVSDTSKAGLTVAVNTAGNKRVLVPGILVLANNGTACIDELDKMQKEDREGMHSAMEQGTISKSKAGLRGIFRANTSVLAAANPVYGRFDLNKDIPDQLKIESSLLDRFDLIFWFIDKPQSKESDMRDALRVLTPPQVSDPEFVKKYVAAAKACVPQLTEDSKNRIASAYSELRAMSPDGLSIGLRSMHALRRLAEASAKIRFSNAVDQVDVDCAVSLLSESWKAIGYDLDRLSGTGSFIRKAIDFVEKFLRDVGRAATMEEISSFGLNEKFSQFDISEAIEKGKRMGMFYEPTHGRIGVVK
ncbi:MAG: ATP-binding protein [Thermoplasmata archaeon]|uniref:ATP-binding protein n=1 Tax=Candidatus Sysuiplasma superficiale TaxID=2823368 RepID=A0A8J7YXW5_9ARCH|nr:ATP-binding protein [Candidatus Sysuiplasma superficiale]